MADELKLFCVEYDDQRDYIEAPSMREAITIWHQHMKVENGADWFGDEEPESCSLIHHNAVRRALTTDEAQP